MLLIQKASTALTPGVICYALHAVADLSPAQHSHISGQNKRLSRHVTHEILPFEPSCLGVTNVKNSLLLSHLQLVAKHVLAPSK